MGAWLEVAEETAAAVIILDAPSISDIHLSDLCYLRAGGGHTPFLVIIGAGDIEAKVSALNAGADVCLVPEVGSSELVARVTALLRRLPFGTSGMVFREGDLSLDLARRAATYQGRQLHLSPYEFRILRDLALQVMDCRARFADSSGDARLTSALQRLRAYAEDLEQASRGQMRRRTSAMERPGPEA
ncbi:MAG: response regulator transcription factor [Anaerolineae bacterium]